MGDKIHVIIKSKPPQLLLAGALIFFFCGLAVLPSMDPDVWWHLKMGELIEQNRTIPRTDIFAYPSPDKPFIVHGWLAEVLFYNFYRIAGWAGVFWLKGLVISLTLALIYWLMVRRGASFLLAALLLSLTAAPSMTGWEIRPQIWSYLCFAFFLLWLDEYQQHERGLFPLPALFFFWANIHASVVLGLGLLLLYWLGALLENLVKKEKGAPLFNPLVKGLLVNFIFSLGVAFLNTYHYRLLLHPFQHMGQEVFPKFLSEWQPPNLATAPLFFIVLGITLGLGILYRRSFPWGEMSTVLALAVMALGALRQVPYFALAAGPFWVLGLKTGAGKREAEALPVEAKKPWQDQPYLLYPLSAVIIAASLILGGYGRSWQALKEEYRWPREAAALVQGLNLKGNMFNFFDWGGYLTYRLWPQQKVFTLGISTDQKVFMDAFTILGGGEAAQKALDQYQIDYIITPALFASGRMLPYITTLYLDPQWILIYQDRRGAVLLRDRPYYQDIIKQYRLPKSRLISMALFQAQEQLDYNPSNSLARLSKALALHISGQRAASLKEVEKVLKQHPSREIAREAQFLERKLKSGTE